MTDVPPPCQSSNSPRAVSRTSSGSTAGPGEKLKTRIAEILCVVGCRVGGCRVGGIRALDALEAGELISLFEPDQAHALSIASNDGDVLYRRAHQHAVLTHQHNLIVQAYLQRADHDAVAVRNLQRDDALTATAVLREILDRRQLAETILRCRQNESLLADDQRVDPLIGAQFHAAHARRLAAHRPD